jgi:DNA-binding PadR family transcriptional regulator
MLDSVSTVALTPTSYLVLGCIATGGPATPYELKQWVVGGIGYFWDFPHSQLYSEPARLAVAGLLSEQRETGGRHRRVFSITKTGRAALRTWLEDSSAQLPDIRDIGLLKLFFAEHTDADHIRALARNQQAAHQERLNRYEELRAAAIPGPAGATIGLGLAWESAANAFWTSIAANPPTE